MDMNKRIYLSGPISGHDYSERKAYFYKVQKMLEEKGFEVFNPMANGLPKDATTHDHMRMDFKMLCECDEILMFPKWNHSAGCTNELTLATCIGCDVKFLMSLEPLIIIETKFE